MGRPRKLTAEQIVANRDAYHKRYYEKNQDKLKEYRKARYQENKDDVKLRRQKRKENNQK